MTIRELIHALEEAGKRLGRVEEDGDELAVYLPQAQA